MEKKKQIISKYFFAFICIISGAIIEYLKVGRDFLGFSSVGTWLIYIGFVMLAVISLQAISNKKRIVDERMKLLAFKASRITFVLVIFAAFVIMIIDGIKTITIPYSLFMSYLIAYLMLVYVIAYKIIERYN
jgi:hypothetical protein